MCRLRTSIRRGFAAFLCLSLVVWSILPTLSHVPRIADTLQEHVQMIAEHGHSHGFQEDLLWAMHGHSHDSVDHDHSHAVAALDDRTGLLPWARDAWGLRPSRDGPYRVVRIERPPRA